MFDPEYDDSREVCADVEIEEDHFHLDHPVFTALLERDAERLIINGYPNVRLIVCTFPAVPLADKAEMIGVVREVPVGYRDMASTEHFAARCRREVAVYANAGWTADPWDLPQDTDPQPF